MIYFSILHRRVFVIVSEKLMAQEETEEVMHTERCSTLGLVRFCLTLCGISEGTVDSQIEIPVAKRKTFLTETSLTIRTWNKFLAIFLVADNSISDWVFQVSYFEEILSIFKVKLNYLNHDINQIVYGSIVFFKYKEVYKHRF